MFVRRRVLLLRDGRPRRAVERVTGGSRDRLGLYTALGMGDGRCYERGEEEKEGLVGRLRSAA